MTEMFYQILISCNGVFRKGKFQIEGVAFEGEQTVPNSTGVMKGTMLEWSAPGGGEAPLVPRIIRGRLVNADLHRRICDDQCPVRGEPGRRHHSAQARRTVVEGMHRRKLQHKLVERPMLIDQFALAIPMTRQLDGELNRRSGWGCGQGSLVSEQVEAEGERGKGRTDR